ncbi:enoyl-CoA hydratase/isomerase family protein [Nocardia salmonicida]
MLTVTITNPPRNFFDEQMSIELDELTRKLMRDDSVGAVVFTGYGTTYMTHFDVSALLRGSRSTPCAMSYNGARVAAATTRLLGRSLIGDRLLRRTPARDLMIMTRTYAALDRLNRMDKVVVTAINGLAFGMGCVFALACDLRFMSQDSEIGLVESNIDMLGAAGGTQRMVRMIGASRAMELLLDGRGLSAADAVQLGLVHQTFPADEVYDHAHSVAQRLCRRSPVVNREIKRMIYDAGTRPLSTALRKEAGSLIATLTTAQAERSMAWYLHSLRSHDPITDVDVKNGFNALHIDGVPGGPHKHPDPGHGTRAVAGN